MLKQNLLYEGEIEVKCWNEIHLMEERITSLRFCDNKSTSVYGRLEAGREMPF